MRKIACSVLLLLCLAGRGHAQDAKEIVLYNWKEYTDLSLLEDFEKQFGIKVVLREYETRDMMLSEVQSDPGAFDVIVATDITVPLLSLTLSL